MSDRNPLPLIKGRFGTLWPLEPLEPFPLTLASGLASRCEPFELRRRLLALGLAWLTTSSAPSPWTMLSPP